MIALCASHHVKAAAWTIAQLREMKVGDDGISDVAARGHDGDLGDQTCARDDARPSLRPDRP